jgi:hypothetical protein
MLMTNKSYRIFGDGPGVSTIRFFGPNAGISVTHTTSATLNVEGPDPYGRLHMYKTAEPLYSHRLIQVPQSIIPLPSTTFRCVDLQGMVLLVATGLTGSTFIKRQMP